MIGDTANRVLLAVERPFDSGDSCGTLGPTTSGPRAAQTAGDLADTKPFGGADMADRTRPPVRSRNDGPRAIDDCDRPAYCRGWCERHYRRWWKHGDPLAIGKPERESIEVRFWRYVEKSPDPDGCWLWTGNHNKATGYATIHLEMGPEWPLNVYVHRLSYEMHVGPIPTGLTIDHLCRTKLCVNPDHLEPVTRAENSRRGNLGMTWEQRRDRTSRPVPDVNPSDGFVFFDDNPTRILLAVMSQERPTTRTIADEVQCSLSTVNRHLRRLRQEGLVGFEPGCAGTLRALVSIVPMGDH